jgi:hypothetical protein
MASLNADLEELLSEPREALDVELKEWLSLKDGDHKALVARAIIALANHGGGRLVIGFEEREDGSFRPASPRPTSLEAWSQDAIQSVVARYLDPAIQCRVEHLAAPGHPAEISYNHGPGGTPGPDPCKEGIA